MEFLKDLALPQAVEHFHLLLVVGGLIAIFFYPYLAFLLGSSVLSYRFNRKGRTEGNELFLRFAKELIDVAMLNKTVPTFLALIPALSLVFVSAQLMQSTEAISVGLTGYGFLLLLVAVVLLYSYRYTFRLGDILGGYEQLLRQDPGRRVRLEQVESYSKENVGSHLRAGRYGVALLTAASFLIVASTPVTINPLNWTDIGSVFGLFLAPDVWLKILWFVAFTAGVTGLGILFFFFAWEGGREEMSEEYRAVVRRIAVQLSVVSLLSQPVLMVLGVMLLPGVSISGSLFVFVGLALLLLFLAGHFLYAYGCDPQARHVGSAFYLFILSSVLLSVSDQVAIHNSTKLHAAELAHRHEQRLDAVKASLGIVAAALTGEDIYNAKCSACHLFEQKKVGPAYKDVLPKYAGKKEQLVAFVLNPVKVDPAFPPMPNQGLKPAEGDSIASYLLAKFSGPLSKPAPDQRRPQQ